VRFFFVSELKKLLEPFITPGGEIIEYPRGNFLIIRDLASNIQRLLEHHHREAKPKPDRDPLPYGRSGTWSLENVTEQTVIHAVKNELALIYFKHKLKRIREKK